MKKQNLMNEIEEIVLLMRLLDEQLKQKEPKSIDHKMRNLWQMLSIQILVYSNLLITLQNEPGEFIPEEVKPTIERFLAGASKVKELVKQVSKELDLETVKH